MVKCRTFRLHLHESDAGFIWSNYAFIVYLNSNFSRSQQHGKMCSVYTYDRPTFIILVKQTLYIHYYGDQSLEKYCLTYISTTVLCLSFSFQDVSHHSKLTYFASIVIQILIIKTAASLFPGLYSQSVEKCENRERISHSTEFEHWISVSRVLRSTSGPRRLLKPSQVKCRLKNDYH